MRVLVLDRVFDGDDVPRVAAVDLLDESGERRRLARARRTAHQDEAAGQPRQPLDARGKAEGREAGRLRGKRPHGGGGATALAMEVDPKASDSPDPVRGIRDPALPVGLA